MKPLYFFAITSSILCAILSIGFVVFDAHYFPIKYKTEVLEYAGDFNLEPSLVFAVIKTESSFNPNAKSKSGAIGLMQLMPKTAKWVAEKLSMANFKTDLLYNPQINIRLGCYYLRYLLDKFEVLETALACYNAGEGTMANHINLNNEVIDYPFVETAKYTQKIKNFAKIYKNKL